MDRDGSAFCSAALAASNVGTWEYDTANDGLWYDSTTAFLFGLPEAAGRIGSSGLDKPVLGILPEDRPLFTMRRDYVLKHGRLYMSEYRTEPRPGDIRHLLARGRFEKDGTERVIRGRGIVVDVTVSEQDEAFGTAVLLGKPSFKGTALDRIADLLLAAEREISALSDLNALATLKPLLHVLLLKLGRLLAREATRAATH